MTDTIHNNPHFTSVKLGEIPPNLRDQSAKYQHEKITNSNGTSSTQKEATEPESTTSKIAKSIGAGLQTASTIFWTGLAGVIIHDEIKYRHKNTNLEPLVAASIICGLGSAAKKYHSLSKKEDTTPAPAVQHTPFSKAVKSLKAGLDAYGLSCTAGILGTLLAESLFHNIRPSNQTVFHIFRTSGILATGVAARTYASLSNSKTSEATDTSGPVKSQTVTSEPVKPKNDAVPNHSATAKPPEAAPSETQPSVQNKTARVLGAALRTSGAVLGTIASLVYLIESNGVRVPRDFGNLFLFATCYSGLHAAGREIRLIAYEEEKAKAAPTPEVGAQQSALSKLSDSLKMKWAGNKDSSNSPPVATEAKRSTLSKVAESVHAAWEVYGLSCILGLAGIIAYQDMTRTYDLDAMYGVIGASAVLGIDRGVIRYQNLSREAGAPSRTISEEWNALSKTKKKCIVAAALTSLTALGVLFVGPDKVAKKINIMAQTFSDTAGKLFNEMAYTTKKKIETKTMLKWIEGYTLQEEMERLAGLPADASCAEILLTCDREPAEVAKHKKAYRAKSLLLHPDKISEDLKKNTDLTNKASSTLNRATDFLRGTQGRCPKPDDDECDESERIGAIPAECPGQEEIGCLVMDEKITIEKRLTEPTWLFGKFGFQAECLIDSDGLTHRVSLDQCKDVS